MPSLVVQFVGSVPCSRVHLHRRCPQGAMLGEMVVPLGGVHRLGVVECA